MQDVRHVHASVAKQGDWVSTRHLILLPALMDLSVLFFFPVAQNVRAPSPKSPSTPQVVFDLSDLRFQLAHWICDGADRDREEIRTGHFLK
jgi:hypothetical protein